MNSKALLFFKSSLSSKTPPILWELKESLWLLSCINHFINSFHIILYKLYYSLLYSFFLFSFSSKTLVSNEWYTSLYIRIKKFISNQGSNENSLDQAILSNGETMILLNMCSADLWTAFDFTWISWSLHFRPSFNFDRRHEMSPPPSLTLIQSSSCLPPSFSHYPPVLVSYSFDSVTGQLFT